MPKQPDVHTFYKSNIDPILVAAQKRVFDHLGINLVQHLDDSLTHAQWLAKVLSQDAQDIVVVADIDAFPCSLEAFEKLVHEARHGKLVGLAQVANHKDPNNVYAGPMFMGIPQGFYTKSGQPDLEWTKTEDVAQILTEIARSTGVDVCLIYPKFAIRPKWALSDHGVFGVGTFYGEIEFFHLFEARKAASIRLFDAVSEGVVSGRHDFESYIKALDANPRKRFRWF